MQQGTSSTPVEPDKLVEELLDQISVRDEAGSVVNLLLSIRELDLVLQGMKPPTVSCGLQEEIAGYVNRPDAAGLLAKLKERLLRAFPSAVRAASNAFKEREAGLSPIDVIKLLACHPEDHPTEATLVAKMYLNGAYETSRDYKYAYMLLISAAEHGSAEAAYLLATAQTTLDMSERNVETYLETDEHLRGRFLRQARDANYEKVFEDEIHSQMSDEYSTDARIDYDMDEWNSDERVKEFEALLSVDGIKESADIPISSFSDTAEVVFARMENFKRVVHPIWQLKAGQYWLEHCNYVIEKYSYLYARPKDKRAKVVRNCVDLMEEIAESWLRKSAVKSAIACWLLAEHFSSDSDDRYQNLFNAAIPKVGTNSVEMALSPLACDFLMEKNGPRYDPILGEECLRKYLEFSKTSGDQELLYLDDGAAAICLATNILTGIFPSPSPSGEARELLLSVAESQYCVSSYACLLSGLMVLRGEGGTSNAELAKVLIQKARRASQFRAKSDRRERQSAVYADIAFKFGWQPHGMWEVAIEQLFNMAEEIEYAGDPACVLHPGDVELLVARNPYVDWGKADLDELRSYADRIDVVSGPYGKVPILPVLASGLCWALQPKCKIPRSSLAQALGGKNSILDLYVFCQLELASRIEPQLPGNEGLDQAIKQLEMVTVIGDGLLSRKNDRPLTFSERELSLRITRGARSILDTQRKLKELSLKAAVATKQLEIELTREQTQRDMLSYLTHTLNNVLSGRPEAARQAMRILGSEMYEDNAGYTAINNIASMMSTFLFAQQLVSTFKTYVTDPDALRKNWVMDQEGDASITTVLAMSLRQTLSQLVFSSSQLDALDRLLTNKGDDAVKSTRKSFMDEMIPLDVSAANAQTVFDWVQNHIGVIHVAIDTTADLHFQSNSTRFTFFFSCFSELIFNALKYSDGTQPIRVTWEKSGDSYVFRCENTWSEDSISNRQGSDKGLVFLDRLARMLDANLEKLTEENRFIAKLRFPEILFKEVS